MLGGGGGGVRLKAGGLFEGGVLGVFVRGCCMPHKRFVGGGGGDIVVGKTVSACPTSSLLSCLPLLQHCVSGLPAPDSG